MAIQITTEQLNKLLADTVSAALQSSQPTSNMQNPVEGNLASPTIRSHTKKPDRPTLDQGIDDSQWHFFTEEWKLYKRMSNLTDANDIVDELRSSCSRELRRSLFDFVGAGNLDGVAEADLLTKLKSIAVVGKNIVVHRQEFHSLSQSVGEPFHNIVSRLKAKAWHCEFTLIICSSGLCEHFVNNYSESMIMDQMVTGLYDEEIQCDVLSND